MDLLADEFVKVYESPEPNTMFCGSPGIVRLENGRLIASMDAFGKRRSFQGPSETAGTDVMQGMVYTSDNRGRIWEHKLDYPMVHARPFLAGKSVYILGHSNDLTIIRSDDGGDTWTAPVRLTDGEQWHQAPCNVHYANGNVYLVMEKKIYHDLVGWSVSVMAPVLMRGEAGSALTRCENWTFASELPFRDILDERDIDYFGVPFYYTPPKSYIEVTHKRPCHPIGWLETNVVQFTDPNHYWYDPSGHTFHLWMRAHTGRTGYACIAKVVETSYGTMTTMLEQAPSGKKMLYVPCPGGQMKFHILYDEVTGLYWLLSTQATDSMTRADKLPEERYNLPDNERNRLQLHFSKNCIDWCFAGMVTIGKGIKHSRHYASMVIDGNDLHVLSRSGDENASNPHNVNLITFHTVKDFRKLVY